MLNRASLHLVLLLAAAWGCSNAGNSSLTKDPPVPTSGQEAAADKSQDVPKGESFYVVFDTSKGPFIVEVNPAWSPQGAARFRELVELKYYDECRYFRVLSGFMAQVGISGDPALNAKWREARIPDDPVHVSNTRGRVTFATGGPNTRTTQIFFNYGDNSMLNAQGFSPFGEVISGMDIVDSLHSGYGEGFPQGNGPDQGEVQDRGNEYLNSKFPKLDYIKTARVYDTKEAAEAAMNEAAGKPAADVGTEPAAAPLYAAPADAAPATESPATEAKPAEPTAADGTKP